MRGIVFIVIAIMINSQAVVGSDRECDRIGGKCQDDNIPCSTGSYLTGLCGGGVHRRCCTIDGPCEGKSGTCQDDWLYCDGGRYETGLCGGGRRRRCCIFTK